MTVLGFNLKKGELYFCSLDGSKSDPAYIAHGRHRLDPSQPRPSLAHFVQQTFRELIEAHCPDRLAYRLSIEAASADQMAYGNRQANAALYLVAIVRMRAHQPTLDYVKRRPAKGKSKSEIIRCLKRYLVREIFGYLCQPKCPPQTASAPS